MSAIADGRAATLEECSPLRGRAFGDVLPIHISHGARYWIPSPSLQACRGTCPLACLSPYLPRYPSPRLSLSPLAEVPIPSLVSLPHLPMCLSPSNNVPVPSLVSSVHLPMCLFPSPPPMRRCTCTCTRPQNGPMLASCLPPMSPPVPSVLPVSEHRSQSLNRNHVKCSEVH